MRNLVRRYVTSEQRQADNQGVTEDDVNEIKQDISAFRCELLEVLKNSGMNTSSASGMGAGNVISDSHFPPDLSSNSNPQSLNILLTFRTPFLSGSGGKKNRQRERRLMKGFNISTAPPSTSSMALSDVLEGLGGLDPLGDELGGGDPSSSSLHFDKKSPKVST
jgi:transient receptor potential cation channel subfamily C protein 4